LLKLRETWSILRETEGVFTQVPEYLGA
jgi:hypothetical protein